MASSRGHSPAAGRGAAYNSRPCGVRPGRPTELHSSGRLCRPPWERGRTVFPGWRPPASPAGVTSLAADIRRLGSPHIQHESRFARHIIGRSGPGSLGGTGRVLHDHPVFKIGTAAKKQAKPGGANSKLLMEAAACGRFPTALRVLRLVSSRVKHLTSYFLLRVYYLLPRAPAVACLAWSDPRLSCSRRSIYNGTLGPCTEADLGVSPASR